MGKERKTHTCLMFSFLKFYLAQYHINANILFKKKNKLAYISQFLFCFSLNDSLISLQSY